MSSRGRVVWCVGRWDTSWYRGIVATTIEVVSYGGYWYSCVWLSPALVKLDVVSALVVLRVVGSSSCEAGRCVENGCVEALAKSDKLWRALEVLRVES